MVQVSYFSHGASRVLLLLISTGELISLAVNQMFEYRSLFMNDSASGGFLFNQSINQSLVQSLTVNNSDIAIVFLFIRKLLLLLDFDMKFDLINQLDVRCVCTDRMQQTPASAPTSHRCG